MHETVRNPLKKMAGLDFPRGGSSGGQNPPADVTETAVQFRDDDDAMSRSRSRRPHLRYYPDDGRYVTSPELLTQSTRVVDAPEFVNRPVPVPSVYRDGRGSIHHLPRAASQQRLHLLYTRAGAYRSGDIHKGRLFLYCMRVKSSRKSLSTK